MPLTEAQKATERDIDQKLSISMQEYYLFFGQKELANKLSKILQHLSNEYSSTMEEHCIIWKMAMKMDDCK